MRARRRPERSDRHPRIASRSERLHSCTIVRNRVSLRVIFDLRLEGRSVVQPRAKAEACLRRLRDASTRERRGTCPLLGPRLRRSLRGGRRTRPQRIVFPVSRSAGQRSQMWRAAHPSPSGDGWRRLGSYWSCGSLRRRSLVHRTAWPRSSTSVLPDGQCPRRNTSGRLAAQGPRGGS